MKSNNRILKGLKSLFSPEKESSKAIDIIESMKLYYSVAVVGFVLFAAVAILLYYSGIGNTPFLHSIVSIIPNVLYLHIVFYAAIAAFLFFLLIPAGLLVNAAIYHVIGKFFLKAWKGSYEKTFGAAVFGEMPILFLGWLMLLPVVRFFAITLICMWSIIILVIALAAQHKIDRTKSFVVLLATLFIIMMISFLIAGGLIGNFYHGYRV